VSGLVVEAYEAYPEQNKGEGSGRDRRCDSARSRAAQRAVRMGGLVGSVTLISGGEIARRLILGDLSGALWVIR
jgi:hypothetical protein